jgi:hypothetical protein
MPPGFHDRRHSFFLTLMPVIAKDLWNLIRGRPQVDPQDLAEAVAVEAAQDVLDYRTRLLIRDSVAALKGYWGSQRLETWLTACPHRERIEAICREPFEEIGFPTLADRLMDKTDPRTIQEFLRELGLQIHRPVRLYVGGSAALIFPGYVSRSTDDIDVVDEVPAEVRALHPTLDQLKKRYGLVLAHFQSHYLPRGWEQRVHSLEPFGRLQVYLIDVYDVFLSKIFSARTKDLDDLRALAPQLDKETIVRRLKETTASLLAAHDQRPKAEKNWYILYGEPLPTEP